MAVNNYFSEYAGVYENTSEAYQYHHHEASNSYTSRKETNIQSITKYIADKGSPFSKSCPTELQNFVTKQVITESIRSSLLNCTEYGKDKYMEFRQNRICDKTTTLASVIHRSNLKNMKSINIKPKKTTKTVLKQRNISDIEVEVSRDRGCTTDDLLQYDIVPSPYLFDEMGFMVKPDKGQLITEMEELLKKEEAIYTKQHNSAFIVDIMNSIRKLPTAGVNQFGDFVSSFRKNTDHYGSFGRVDYVFDIYSEQPSVKDSERQRRMESAPNIISTIE